VKSAVNSASKALDQPSDAAALQAVAGGEISGLGVIYDRHQASVFRFVSRALNGSHDVEDLVHATFMTAAKAAATFDGRQSCRPWLLGIAARLVQRRRRTASRWLRTLRDLAVHQKNWHLDPHRELVARDQVTRLTLAVDRLSEAKRVVLLLAEVEGMSSEEIASALCIPVGTVWTRLHHARNDLRRLLDERDVQ
jgi:RNA polymerase sigma-70 factor (ECF subfamily)